MVVKFFDLVGETNISLKIGDIEEKVKGNYLPREKYIELRNGVEEFLITFSETSGVDREVLLSKLTSEGGQPGIKTLFKMSVPRLNALREHLLLLIQEEEVERVV